MSQSPYKKFKVFNSPDESPYYFEYETLRFYFSSKYYRDKFCKEVHHYVKNRSDQLSKRNNLDVELKHYFAISLYKKIEKRGFRIEHKFGNLKSNFELTSNYRIKSRG